MLPFIVAGLTAGSVYALAGVGLVLTYKTSGVFNFAHGAMATVSAYLFYALTVEHGMPWPAAAFVCIFIAGPVLGLAFERMARTLATADLATRVVSTIGVLLLVQAVAVIVYGLVVTRIVPPYLPTRVFDIGGTAVTADRIIVFAVGAVATAGLGIYFRTSRMGVAMRAVVDDPTLLDTAGTSPIVVRRWAWIIGLMFASASGLLLVPFITLNSITLTFLVVAAFGAAALGQFRNLFATYVGGLAIGVGAALASKYFTGGLLSGLPASLPFLVLFVVLLVSPRSRLADRTPSTPPGRSSWRAPWQFQGFFGLALLVVMLLVPSFAGIHLADYSQFLAMTVLFLSLGLLVRTSGQVSLCHVTFMAIGACGFSHLVVDRGWPWGLGLLAAGAIAIPIGALLAIPAIRLSGLYLALATFGFGIWVQYMFYTENYMFGGEGLGLQVPMPHAPGIGLTGTDKSYYYLCLVLTLAAVGVMVAINRSRLGRLLRALADSPLGLATSGASIHVTRVLVFCLSAFVAAVAGALAAGAVGQAGGESYQPITSLIYFAVIIISLGGVPWYALVAAAGLTLVPSYSSNVNTAYWLQVLFGVTAIAYAMTPASAKGTPEPVRRLLDRVFRRSTPEQAVPTPARSAAPAPRRQPARAGALRVEHLRVASGGLVALDDVSVEAPTGRITGLIGPNGAGKTTLFNACSGLNRPSGGTITLSGHAISRRSPAARARLGLGRTFQQMQLFDTLTVWDNVALGVESSRAGLNVLGHLFSTPRTMRIVVERTQEALEQCGLLDLAGRTAGSLSTGQRRLVELARCLAGPYQVLLLDEPSSGLDRIETAKFGEIIQQVVRQRGVGILLVEHDMGLVTDVCDYIFVLDFGRPIFEGTPPEVMASEVVQSAYLGGDGAVRTPATAGPPVLEASR